MKSYLGYVPLVFEGAHRAVDPDLPVFEDIHRAAQRFVGQITSNHMLAQIEQALNAVLRDRAWMLPLWMSGDLPFKVVVLAGRSPGEVWWAFQVLSGEHLFWTTLAHHDEMQRHFPAELFFDGRPVT